MEIFHSWIATSASTLIIRKGQFLYRMGSTKYLVNTLRPRQNGGYFADNILKCIFVKENVWILIEISLKFVPKGPIDNIPALV